MRSEEERKIKCVVWDLDDTLWDGVLMEHDPCLLKRGVVDTIKELDDRGLLQSIASKNEESSAMEKLKSYGLSDYFLYPMINFDSKSSSIEKIATLLNIGTDA
ncbi:MAG: HAD-IIIC family phosphatase, partial [Candidatus Scalindua sp.]|nr:HAD-IIIC family phosphatase [Candidatus Scalindua sp.]